jgi:hypothetical protein
MRRRRSGTARVSTGRGPHRGKRCGPTPSPTTPEIAARTTRPPASKGPTRKRQWKSWADQRPYRARPQPAHKTTIQPESKINKLARPQIEAEIGRATSGAASGKIHISCRRCLMRIRRAGFGGDGLGRHAHVGWRRRSTRAVWMDSREGGDRCPMPGQAIGGVAGPGPGVRRSRGTICLGSDGLDHSSWTRALPLFS